MSAPFSKVGLAIAFSPTAVALLAEAYHIVQMLNADLVLIHVGVRQPDSAHQMDSLFAQAKIPKDRAKIVWEEGDPTKKILKVTQREKIDLLLVGALKKERFVSLYIGTIARRIMRKARCSVLVICKPTAKPTPIKNIVVNAEDSNYIEDATRAACWIGMREDSHWIHIVRELKLLGLTMSAANEYTEDEYNRARQQLVQSEIDEVKEMLKGIPHEGLHINVKVISGKSGFELSRFTRRKKAELLVVGAPTRKFFWLDRVFPHDLEYIFADLPCNLLIIQKLKKPS
ncbi:MAG: universal stress protein [Cyclobacteriaceae bacterium]